MEKQKEQVINEIGKKLGSLNDRALELAAVFAEGMAAAASVYHGESEEKEAAANED